MKLSEAPLKPRLELKLQIRPTHALRCRSQGEPQRDGIHRQRLQHLVLYCQTPDSPGSRTPFALWCAFMAPRGVELLCSESAYASARFLSMRQFFDDSRRNREARIGVKKLHTSLTAYRMRVATK